MTLRFPPSFKVFGKGYKRSGRGGRKFESCRLDDDRIPGNVEKSRFLGIFVLLIQEKDDMIIPRDVSYLEAN